MKPNQFLNEGKANTCSFIRATLRAGNAMEPLKDLFKLVVWNTCSCIADGKFYMSCVGAQRHFNFSLEGELEGIGQQIQNDCFPHISIYKTRARVRKGNR